MFYGKNTFVVNNKSATGINQKWNESKTGIRQKCNKNKTKVEQDQTICASHITTWLSDLERHSEAFHTAILEGKLLVTTKAGFDQVLDKTKKAFEERKKADDRAEKLQRERDELAHAIVCILKSFEGVAASSEEWE